MESPIRPGARRTGAVPPRAGAPCVRCATVNRPGARFCDRCGGLLDAGPASAVHRQASPGSAALPSPDPAPATVARTTYVPYPVPVRDDRRDGSSFGTGFGLSLGWIAGRLVFQLLMLALFLFVGIALLGPFLSALRIW